MATNIRKLWRTRFITHSSCSVLSTPEQVHTVRSRVEKERNNEFGALALLGSESGCLWFSGSLFIDEFKVQEWKSGASEGERSQLPRVLLDQKGALPTHASGERQTDVCSDWCLQSSLNYSSISQSYSRSLWSHHHRHSPTEESPYVKVQVFTGEVPAQHGRKKNMSLNSWTG